MNTGGGGRLTRSSLDALQQQQYTDVEKFECEAGNASSSSAAADVTVDEEGELPDAGEAELRRVEEEGEGRRRSKGVRRAAHKNQTVDGVEEKNEKNAKQARKKSLAKGGGGGGGEDGVLGGQRKMTSFFGVHRAGGGLEGGLMPVEAATGAGRGV
jgi:hypothetical protein